MMTEEQIEVAAKKYWEYRGFFGVSQKDIDRAKVVIFEAMQNEKVKAIIYALSAPEGI